MLKDQILISFTSVHFQNNISFLAPSVLSIYLIYRTFRSSHLRASAGLLTLECLTLLISGEKLHP